MHKTLKADTIYQVEWVLSKVFFVVELKPAQKWELLNFLMELYKVFAISFLFTHTHDSASGCQ